MYVENKANRWRVKERERDGERDTRVLRENESWKRAGLAASIRVSISNRLVNDRLYCAIATLRSARDLFVIPRDVITRTLCATCAGIEVVKRSHKNCDDCELTFVAVRLFFTRVTRASRLLAIKLASCKSTGQTPWRPCKLVTDPINW